MEQFRADVVFDFEADSLEAAGRKVRRLDEAARAVDFHLRHFRVEPRPHEPESSEPRPDEPESPSSSWTPYAPLDP
jgi:hypothetical protein